MSDPRVCLLLLRPARPPAHSPRPRAPNHVAEVRKRVRTRAHLFGPEHSPADTRQHQAILFGDDGKGWGCSNPANMLAVGRHAAQRHMLAAPTPQTAQRNDRPLALWPLRFIDTTCWRRKSAFMSGQRKGTTNPPDAPSTWMPTSWPVRTRYASSSASSPATSSNAPDAFVEKCGLSVARGCRGARAHTRPTCPTF